MDKQTKRDTGVEVNFIVSQQFLELSNLEVSEEIETVSGMVGVESLILA